MTSGSRLLDSSILAACAMQHNLTLAGRDEHFSWIDGLDFERW